MSSSTGITADFDQLMEQAPETVELYMFAAVAKIDKVFGAGYAKQHPELVGAFIQAAAIDYKASSDGKVIGEALNDIAESLNSVSAAISEVARSCDVLADVANELESVTSAIRKA